MITYEELHHVGINVTNLEKAKQFYREILCLEELERPPFDFEGAWFAVGNQQIHLLVIPESQTIRRDKRLSSREGHFALRVKDYEGTLQWLKKNNIDVLEKPDSTSGFAQIFCADPDGNLIELHVERT
ncbi:VOC family protein [Domibacillus epiphyticus]|uniref:Glyoxalase n=1 Tax=Domibacillus epiphyticus TaxID=1714355 RepID=A0A1V2A3X1_9BACI|nr:VOC family protein [Domibacillus epiphyticus]OMP65699.1 glyoxalase [Domibacillus epiphyticus]